MNRLALVALVSLWLVACESTSAPTSLTSFPRPSFQTVLNERVPVGGSFDFNPCPPEEFVDILDGYFHYLETEDVGPTSQSVTIRVNAEGITGIGETSGEGYSVPANSTDEVTITDPPPTFTERYDLRYRLIRDGSLDNLWLHLSFTYTFPADITDQSLEIECRG